MSVFERLSQLLPVRMGAVMIRRSTACGWVGNSRKSYTTITGIIALILCIALWQRLPPVAPSLQVQPVPVGGEQSQWQAWVQHTSQLTDYFTAYPLSETEFGQMGKRVKILREWLKAAESVSTNLDEASLVLENTERLALSMFPFIQGPQVAKNETHLRRLRSSYVPGSRGIVIPTGTKSFRYACHLILNLRIVLGSTLPIEVAYAGEEDLPSDFRDFIKSLGSDISTINLLEIFDDKTLDLANGGWAIKSFALLGSSFEQAMHVDADAVFVQKAEVLFEKNPEYQDTGTFLFHDRLLWQGGFPERHAWWEKELAHMEISNTTRISKVYSEGYAEEGDSGVVVVDKSRIDVLAGLLHICWQNSKAPREKLTYTMGYGDKESWWFGFELAGTPYSMEKHYAAILGQFTESSVESPEDRVCSFGIAHVDREDELLWYNGSLLKNKRTNETEFDIPKVWMVDGEWEKSGDRFQPSCMKGSRINWCSQNEMTILGRSVEEAQKMDRRLVEKFPDSMAVYTNQVWKV